MTDAAQLLRRVLDETDPLLLLQVDAAWRLCFFTQKRSLADAAARAWVDCFEHRELRQRPSRVAEWPVINTHSKALT